MPFFIADGIFGWTNAKIDDGSSNEMGQLANWNNKDGFPNLPADSPWRVDLPKIMSLVTYQADTSMVAVPWIVNAYSASGREINDVDKLYHSGGGGGGNGGSPAAPGY